MNNGAPQVPDANEPKLFKADILRVTGWSARKLDGLMGGRKGKAKLLYWRDGTGSRAPRFTQQWCLDEFFGRKAAGPVPTGVQRFLTASPMVARIAQLEKRIEQLERRAA